VIRIPSKDIFNFSSVQHFMFLSLLQKISVFREYIFGKYFENRGRLTPWDSRIMPACCVGVVVLAGFGMRVYTYLVHHI